MKSLFRRAAVHAALLGIFAGSPSLSVAQQSYPTRPITFIVPASAGGPSDAVARLIAEAMGRRLGQTIIVENIGGAGGTIGSVRVARAKPDGYTLLLWHIAHATAPALYEKTQYNVITDFEPIGRVADAPLMLVARTDHPAKTIDDLLAWMREKKTDATYGHAGAGTSSHLCGTLLSDTLGVPMTGVPYKGTGPAMNDLFGGQIGFMCDQTTNTTGPITSGRIHGYAVATFNRLPTFPNLPRLSEAGLPGFEISAWHGLWAPKGTSKEVVDKLVSALQDSLKDPKVLEKFSGLGVLPATSATATPAALNAHLKAEVARWGALIKASGMRAE